MTAFILLRVGKEFSLPDGISAAIIGLFFGIICGLFYYQHYYKPYFWGFSLGGGLILTILSNAIFARLRNADDAAGIGFTIASFGIPFVLTLALNHALHLVKRSKRRRRKFRPRNSQFFDGFDASETNQPDPKLSRRNIGA
jgi:hypothetical protein